MRTTRIAPGKPTVRVLCSALLLACAAGCERPGTEAAPPAGADGAEVRPVISAAGGPAWKQAIRRDLPRPTTNVVLFLIDTLRADRIGAYGYDQPTTPTIDALAAEAVLFENATAPAPWTLPSVPSILTSTFTCEHGLNVDGEKLSEEIPTMAELLREVGYYTAQLYANGYAGPTTGLDRGYAQSKRIAGTEGRDVEAWNAERPDQPFFLYIHNIEPHMPHKLTLAPREVQEALGGFPRTLPRQLGQLRARYRPLVRFDWSNNQPLGTTDNTAAQDAALRAMHRMWREHQMLYDVAVRWSDYRLRSCIDALKSAGLWEDTLFILLADHGEELGDHGAYLHSQSAYQELMHVPLLVKFPRGEFRGTRVAQQISLVDVLPTVLDFLGRRDLAPGARGASLMPLVRGEPLEPAALPRVLGLRMNEKKYYKPWAEVRGNVNIVVRLNEFKGIYNADAPLQTLELYDVVADPRERNNLCADHPELAATMGRLASEWLGACAAHGHGAARGAISEAEWRELEALGYVGNAGADSDEPDAEPEPDAGADTERFPEVGTAGPARPACPVPPG